MKLAFCSDLCDGLFEVSNDLDCLICCGNFLPIYDKELLTWNITNQVDWVDSTLNKWIERYPSTCFVFSGGPNLMLIIILKQTIYKTNCFILRA